MQIMAPADATALVATVVSYLTENWAAILILVGFGVGLSLFRRLVNNGIRGRF